MACQVVKQIDFFSSVYQTCQLQLERINISWCLLPSQEKNWNVVQKSFSHGLAIVGGISVGLRVTEVEGTGIEDTFKKTSQYVVSAFKYKV